MIAALHLRQNLYSGSFIVINEEIVLGHTLFIMISVIIDLSKGYLLSPAAYLNTSIKKAISLRYDVLIRDGVRDFRIEGSAKGRYIGNLL